MARAEAVISRIDNFQRTLERQLLQHARGGNLVRNGDFPPRGNSWGADSTLCQDTGATGGASGRSFMLRVAHSMVDTICTGGSGSSGRCGSGSYGGIQQTITGLTVGEHYVLTYKGVGGSWDDQSGLLESGASCVAGSWR